MYRVVIGILKQFHLKPLFSGWGLFCRTVIKAALGLTLIGKRGSDLEAKTLYASFQIYVAVKSSGSSPCLCSDSSFD